MNETPFRHALIAGLLAVMLVTLPGCATKKPGEPIQTNSGTQEDGGYGDNRDPLEPLNRGLFKFNEVLDGVLLSPLAHIYRGVMPDFAQRSVRNFLVNLNSPVVFVNSMLQWDTDNAGRTVERFAINSTVGIAGLFDVATPMGIKKEHKKDFGQTLGVWGVGTGPYLYLPILGPSDIRDGVGMIADIFDDPFTYIFTWQETAIRDGVRIITTRADYLPLTDRINRDSLDPYTSYRSIYLQHRDKVVRNYLNRDAGLDTGKSAEKGTGK